MYHNRSKLFFISSFPCGGCSLFSYCSSFISSFKSFRFLFFLYIELLFIRRYKKEALEYQNGLLDEEEQPLQEQPPQEQLPQEQRLLQEHASQEQLLQEKPNRGTLLLLRTSSDIGHSQHYTKTHVI